METTIKILEELANAIAEAENENSLAAAAFRTSRLTKARQRATRHLKYNAFLQSMGLSLTTRAADLTEEQAAVISAFLKGE